MAVSAKIELLRKSLPEIQGKFLVTGLCVFGSMARGDQAPGSDIDILVDMPPVLSLLHALQEYLEGLLQMSVDVVRRHSRMSSRFLNQVAKDAVVLL